MSKLNWGISPIPEKTWRNMDFQWTDWINSFFTPTVYKTDFPVNILEERKDGKVTSVIEVALAGISKDRIKVLVTEGEVNYLSIDVSKAEDNRDAVYKGTSNKKWHISYALTEEHDKDNIKSDFVDGLLRILIPVVESKPVEKKVIEIPIS